MEKSDNELIAEFMGKSIHENFPVLREVTTSQLKFHTSWDWLMPAYNKFSSLDLDAYEFPDYCASIAEKVLEFDVAGASEVLVLGIKWYNQQK